MKNKFILEIIESGEILHFKSMREIADKLGIDYHAARGLYIYNTKGKKHLHAITKSLSQKYKIYDDPEYLNFLH
jgi:acid phosphatase class B